MTSAENSDKLFFISPCIDRYPCLFINAALEALSRDFSLQRQDSAPLFLESKNINITGGSQQSVANHCHASNHAVWQIVPSTESMEATNHLHQLRLVRILQITVDMKQPFSCHFQEPLILTFLGDYTTGR